MKEASDYQYGFDGMTHKRMVEKMKLGWRSDETPCGRGSEMEHTRLIRQWLPHLVHDYGIVTIADCGAGDLNWILNVEWVEEPDYLAYDLEPRADQVIEFDVTSDVLEDQHDLILCRHVLNHLSPKLALDAMDNFVESRSKYLLITNCDNQKAYWLACGIVLNKPIEEWKDATKWWCELHDLQSIMLWARRC